MLKTNNKILRHSKRITKFDKSENVSAKHDENYRVTYQILTLQKHAQYL